MDHERDTRGRAGPPPRTRTDRAALLAAMDALECLFQPVVDLDTSRVVGYEALVRGPRGPLHAPDALFAAAAEHGLTAKLDWTCRQAAAGSARAAGLGPALELFVNVEPLSLDRPVTPEIAAQASLFAGMSVTVEVTERDLAAHLPGMLRTADWIRSQGWRIAVDDVGAEPSSLALLPLLRPEVIKLDLRLVQSNTTVEIADIVTAANAEAERTGAQVLAEGIETAGHAELAQMIGATLGQGWRYGRPGPLGVLPAHRGPSTVGRRVAVHHAVRQSLELGGFAARVRVSSRPLLAAISEQLWGQAEMIGGPAVVLCSIGDGVLTPELLERYSVLARRCTYVAVVATRFPGEPGRGLHTATLAPGDPACGQRNLVVLGPHFAGALLARAVPGSDPARFAYVVTYDRTTVLAAARELLDHLP